jgi:hypothetical protein
MLRLRSSSSAIGSNGAGLDMMTSKGRTGNCHTFGRERMLMLSNDSAEPRGSAALYQGRKAASAPAQLGGAIDPDCSFVRYCSNKLI